MLYTQSWHHPAKQVRRDTIFTHPLLPHGDWCGIPNRRALEENNVANRIVLLSRRNTVYERNVLGENYCSAGPTRAP